LIPIYFGLQNKYKVLGELIDMSLLLNQIKCAFNGHEAIDDEVRRLNAQDFRESNGERIKEISTHCKRCNYPIILRKYESSPNKYFIIE
jgi:hypothetical protein